MSYSFSGRLQYFAPCQKVHGENYLNAGNSRNALTWNQVFPSKFHDQTSSSQSELMSFDLSSPQPNSGKGGLVYCFGQPQPLVQALWIREEYMILYRVVKSMQAYALTISRALSFESRCLSSTALYLYQEAQTK
ncbi:hypothetical protein Ahy_A08g037860 isoform D [Arachis hypogaea]|uniref:Uncharacterized protein n=1 Tax=Arachis hypogaea TaxID=3818 RepID=A0A445BS02_ARAHY|nr:hypothetical protein Ahy_A08g037860 isoform D [Arachis hypogaea]